MLDLDRRFSIFVRYLHSSNESRQLSGVAGIIHVADAWEVLSTDISQSRIQDCVDSILAYLKAPRNRPLGDDIVAPPPRARALSALGTRLRGVDGEISHFPVNYSRLKSEPVKYFWSAFPPGSGLLPRYAPVSVDLMPLNLGVPLARVIDAFMSGMCLDYSFFKGGQFTGVDFSGSSLRDVNMVDSKMERVDCSCASFGGADLTGSVASRCNFFASDFQQANGLGLSILDSDLTHANFAMADLRSADFTGSTVSNQHDGCTPFDGASVCRDTVFPDGARIGSESADELRSRWGNFDIVDSIMGLHG